MNNNKDEVLDEEDYEDATIMEARCIRKWAVRKAFALYANGQPVIKTSTGHAESERREASRILGYETRERKKF